MKKGTSRPTLKVKNIPAVLEREAIRNSFNFTFLHTGENYFEKNGKRISVSDFEKNYPEIKLQPATYKGENSDIKKNWIHDGKSY